MVSASHCTSHSLATDKLLFDTSHLYPPHLPPPISHSPLLASAQGILAHARSPALAPHPSSILSSILSSPPSPDSHTPPFQSFFLLRPSRQPTTSSKRCGVARCPPSISRFQRHLRPPSLNSRRLSDARCLLRRAAALWSQRKPSPWPHPPRRDNPPNPSTCAPLLTAQRLRLRSSKTLRLLRSLSRHTYSTLKNIYACVPGLAPLPRLTAAALLLSVSVDSVPAVTR